MYPGRQPPSPRTRMWPRASWLRAATPHPSHPPKDLEKPSSTCQCPFSGWATALCGAFCLNISTCICGIIQHLWSLKYLYRTNWFPTDPWLEGGSFIKTAAMVTNAKTREVLELSETFQVRAPKCSTPRFSLENSTSGSMKRQNPRGMSLGATWFSWSPYRQEKSSHFCSLCTSCPEKQNARISL